MVSSDGGFEMWAEPTGGPLHSAAALREHAVLRDSQGGKLAWLPFILISEEDNVSISKCSGYKCW